MDSSATLMGRVSIFMKNGKFGMLWVTKEGNKQFVWFHMQILHKNGSKSFKIFLVDFTCSC
jgi:hypothetical protein